METQQTTITNQIPVREKLKLTGEKARDILYEGDAEFKVIKDKIIENSRWSILHSLIIQRISDGKFFRDSYSVGATEMQDEGAWEYNEPNFVEVFEKEKIIKVYE